LHHPESEHDYLIRRETMPKSTKHAVLICSILTLVALIGIVTGVWKNNSIVVIAFLLPAVLYEVYRTEGFFTKLASIGILAVLVIEIVMIAAGLNFNLSQYLGSLKLEKAAIDAKLAGPVIIAILSIYLLRMTAGIYTKWLSVVIFVTSLALFYVLDASLFKRVLDYGGKVGTERIQQKVQGIKKF